MDGEEGPCRVLHGHTGLTIFTGWDMDRGYESPLCNRDFSATRSFRIAGGTTV